MAEKDVTNFNFSMPNALAEEFRRIGDVHGERNKLRWAVAAAAVLKLLEMPEEERASLVQRVYGARHFPAAIDELIAEAKAKATDPPEPHNYRRPLGTVTQGGRARVRGAEPPAPETGRAGEAPSGRGRKG